jgi:hypothetical protein
MAQLTPAGRRRLAEAAPTHVAGVRRYLIDVLAAELGSLADGLARVEAALDEGGEEVGFGCPETQAGGAPGTTSPPRSIQPFVPPATETAS